MVLSQVQGHLKSLIQEHFTEDLAYVIRDPILFGDYRNTLMDSEPRVYEDIQDYDASYALFEVLVQASLKFLTLKPTNHHTANNTQFI